ncbi:hypothetical protein Pla52o_08560 [Novipirellula galeiformis]|uniref:Uncharacterized protein n=1 Tax=Novipirellula galeiformis TaxID=2528004 RepID=A0A5C6CR09_9BACT|nr:hypothetical protein Pla52o_08560 [Novipirellula galeiformis]
MSSMGKEWGGELQWDRQQYTNRDQPQRFRANSVFAGKRESRGVLFSNFFQSDLPATCVELEKVPETDVFHT